MLWIRAYLLSWRIPSAPWSRRETTAGRRVSYLSCFLSLTTKRIGPLSSQYTPSRRRQGLAKRILAFDILRGVDQDDRRHVSRQDAEYGAGHWLPAHRPALYGRNSRYFPPRRLIQPSLLLVSRKLSAATAARERSDFILAHDTPSPRRPKPQSWLGSAAPSRHRISRRLRPRRSATRSPPSTRRGSRSLMRRRASRPPWPLMAPHTG
jgi:hypothetical protein